MALNVKKGLVLILSSDQVSLWSNQSSEPLKKERSLFAAEGCQFLDGKFTLDGSKVSTLLKDGDFI